MKYQKLAYKLMQGKKQSREEWAEEMGTQPRYLDQMVNRINRETNINIFTHDGILDVQSIAEKNLECEGLLRKNRILKQDNEALWERISNEQQKSIWKQMYEYARGLRGKK